MVASFAPSIPVSSGSSHPARPALPSPRVSDGRRLRVADADADTDARARLAALVPRLGSATMTADRVVPVHPALANVLPQGLVQGCTVGCTGSSATSLALLMVAEASRHGAWVGIAGLPHLGVQAAGAAGVDVERLVAVREQRRFDDGTWGQILAAMVDGFDLVLVGPGVQVRAGTARRLQARAQPRGAVLVLAGEVSGFTTDLQVRADAEWDGLGDGHGHLRSRRVNVEVHGRRVPRPRHDELWFPALDGRIVSVRDSDSATDGSTDGSGDAARDAVVAAAALERAG